MNRHLRVLVAGCALLGVIGAARAESESLVFLEHGPLARYDLRLNGVNMNDINAGWLKFGHGSPTATDYLFCTEITQYIAPQGKFKDYERIQKNGHMGWLLNQYDDLMASDATDKGARAAGLQAAIWEVKYEGEQDSYDLSSGKFKIRDADNALGNESLVFADQYLSDMGSNTADYFLYHNDRYQDMVGTAPVPEPATLAALGFGAMFLRRRKRKA